MQTIQMDIYAIQWNAAAVAATVRIGLKIKFDSVCSRINSNWFLYWINLIHSMKNRI